MSDSISVLFPKEALEATLKGPEDQIAADFNEVTALVREMAEQRRQARTIRPEVISQAITV